MAPGYRCATAKFNETRDIFYKCKHSVIYSLLNLLENHKHISILHFIALCHILGPFPYDLVYVIYARRQETRTYEFVSTRVCVCICAAVSSKHTQAQHCMLWVHGTFYMKVIWPGINHTQLCSLSLN